MSGPRALLARVQRLERARMPRKSRIVRAYGSFEAFEAKCREEMATGELDRDFPISALARWEREQLW